jgi:ketosteroid isomerase-like protein
MLESERQVQEANVEFYRALEAGSLEMMDRVWLHEDWVRCVHPGWEMIVGWRRVRDSWRTIFEGGQNMKIFPSDVWVRTFGDLAWVTCTENITLFEEEGNFESAQAAATNIFIRRQGRWLMVHHHASPLPVIVPENATDTVQ